ncbi:TRAP transporter small permease [Alcaligenes ammonioxydans]|jgi:TRAP-type C4-dicarboxylate transport system permease small subunit|uniref:TRAP transporter small permease n=1 Tax=Alcaligenes TaxID=507 RepID=UPI000269E7B4|nr:TRAP transporter small permease [Alcaligenes ammonioxydans]EJC61413.1 putative TRAP-type C4-dicarboxylate transport system small permease [Alcaligenes faecalis subsp. faecalis NCIB 8687]MCH1880134.1 TRAP transporter small permease [Alcaligenes ammonioxydans]QBH19702.1 TRAP transporter small permease [Alcaligenes faecalis]WGQ35755.1 TRAP transporter small permease [Alcaligenes faecalis]
MSAATAPEGQPSNPTWGRPYALLMHTCGAVAAVTFGLMSLLVCADVILRNLGYDALSTSVEVTEYMLIIATFVAAPWVLYLGGHIRIDVLFNTLPASAQRGLDLLSNLLGLGVCGTLAWQCALVALDSHEQGAMVFKALIFPEWWLNLPLLFGAGLLALEFFRRLISRSAAQGA